MSINLYNNKVHGFLPTAGTEVNSYEWRLVRMNRTDDARVTSVISVQV